MANKRIDEFTEETATLAEDFVLMQRSSTGQYYKVDLLNILPGYSVDGDNISWDMWLKSPDTWTYLTATTFQVSGDVTATYTEGSRVKFTQTTVKYGTIASSSYSAPNTTVTLIANTDYSIANAAITANYYSYAARPKGYPEFFNYTATLTNVSGGSVQVSRFSVVNGRVNVDYRYSLGGAGVTGAITVALPIAVNSTNHTAESPIGYGYMLDTGTQLYTGVPLANGSSAILRPVNAAATYATFATNTSSTVPFTWGSGDVFGFTANYNLV